MKRQRVAEYKIRIHRGWLLLFALFFSACAQPDVISRGRLPLLAVNEAPRANFANHCVEQFNPALDYFPDKVEFKHSTQLSVEYHGITSWC